MAYKSYLHVLLLWILSCGSVQAIILSHSGNISIPNTFDGVFVTFNDVADASDFSTATSTPASWSLNPFFGGAAFATSDTFLPVLASTATNSDILNLSFGTTVDSGSDYPAGFSGSPGHMGTGTNEFENGTSGYIGFALVDGSDNYYGWMQLTLYDDGSVGTIHQWAWESTANTAITVGAVPEPSNAALLLGLSAILWVGTRRRNLKA